jgi:hypothetical protein
VYQLLFLIWPANIQKKLQMDNISTFQKLRRFFLYFLLLSCLMPTATLQAGAVGNIQILEQQVEELPIKPKLEKKKKDKEKTIFSKK